MLNFIDRTPVTGVLSPFDQLRRQSHLRISNFSLITLSLNNEPLDHLPVAGACLFTCQKFIDKTPRTKDVLPFVDL